MPKKILLTNKYAGAAEKIIREKIPDGFKLLMLDTVTRENLISHVPEANYLLCSGRLRIDREILERAKNLKMIRRTGVGTDTLDIAAAKKFGIPIYVERGINSRSVAEHALLLTLAGLRNLPAIHRNTAKGIWKKQEQGLTTHELGGKIVGIVGLGNIGKKFAEMLAAFDVKILYCGHKKLNETEEFKIGAEYVTLENLLHRSDIISLHAPLTEETFRLISDREFSLMKTGAIIVNTARGKIIDTPALINALAEKKISFAGIDVYEDEPFSEPHPLSEFENVILTPHIAGITHESFAEMISRAFDNIKKFDSGDIDAIRKFRIC